MKSNAPGQFLGYSIQFPRALFHLLKSEEGDIVCVEVLGDVATKKEDATVISEEDKSSVVSNPLTDKSTDLWKTFSNWIEAIKDKTLIVDKTRFIIYTNKAGRESIINAFSKAKDEKSAKAAIKKAKKKLKDVDGTHEIWPFYDLVINQNEALLIDVIQRFELQIGAGSVYKEVLRDLKSKLVPESQVEFLMEGLGGWLDRKIIEKIEKKEPANIEWKEFQKHSLVLFDRVRKRELVDFALQNPPADKEIKKQVKERPLYLKELDAIETTDDAIIEAVTDFIRAKVNRDKWIEHELIDETVAADFESRLNKFWDNQRKKIELTQKGMEENERGQLLYLECKMRQEPIRDMYPPVSTVAGTFHSLVNEKNIGWHPNWTSLTLAKKK